jgi:5'-nucleotidase
MSAAIEGGIHGVPSIGFSLLNHKWNADFSHIKEYIKIITLKTLNNGLPKKVVLNVNFPNVIKKEIKGIKICRQANTYWIEKFDKRKNPLGKNYYWLTGEFINNDKRIDTDEWALSNNYISIVPTQFDFTSEIGLTKLNNWDFEK